MRHSILIVEDEALLARNMARFLGRRGLATSVAGTLAEAIARYQDARPSIIFADHNLPDGDGLSLIRRVRNLDGEVKMVMITAHGSIALAVDAIKAGADDCLTKPIALEELGLLADRLIARMWS